MEVKKLGDIFLKYGDSELLDEDFLEDIEEEESDKDKKRY